MRSFWTLAIGFVSALYIATYAYAGPGLDRVFASQGTIYGCVENNNQCNIFKSPGGELNTFLQAAAEVTAAKMLLVIDGPCASACVLLADYARPWVCLSTNAIMLVHQGTRWMVWGYANETPAYRQELGRFEPPQSSDIDKWVKANGGYPADGVREIPLAAAKKFWPMCQYQK